MVNNFGWFWALSPHPAFTDRGQRIDEFLEIALYLIPPITAFFDKVLVMAEEDKAVKENRLGLLQRIASLANGVADLSKLEGF